jgi:Protein of unknown function (DUF3551)
MKLSLGMALFIVPVGAAAITTSAGAQNYPWCSYFADGAGTNCGFSTLQQCQITTAQGAGGSCERNNQYQPSAAAAPLAPRKPPKEHSRNPS